MEEISDQQRACITLRKYLRPGATVYTILRHRSPSGLMRCISVVSVTSEGTVRQLDHIVTKATGRRLHGRYGGLVISGAGMDMGFALVYELGRALWPNGTKRPHGTRNEQPDYDGGYALKHAWL